MTSPKHDPVHHPLHYTSGAVECIDAIEAALGPEGFIAFLRGQVLKYNWRMGQKDAPVQEAGKAKWYMDKLADRLKQQMEAQKQSAEVASTIQGEALTDKKEIQNEPRQQFPFKRYGTFAELCCMYGSLHVHSDSHGHYILTDTHGRVCP